VLKLPSTPHDSYSLLALGNIYLRADQLDRAASFYSKVLRTDSRNVYAANGIGCVLACKGHLQQAKEVFLNVREATGGDREVVDAWLNLAHIYVSQEQYVDAITLYETCLSRFLGSNDTAALACLARAYFKAAKYPECKVVLQRSLHTDPRDDRVRFNLALAQQRHAMVELQRPGHSLQQVEAALKELDEARAMFMHLKAPAAKVKYDPGRAAAEARRCDDLISQGKTLQTRAAEQQRQRDALASQQQASRQAILDRQRELELAREQAEAVEEELRRQRLAMYDTKVKAMGALTPKVPEAKEPKARKGGGGGRRRKKGDEAFIDDGTMADDMAVGELSASSSDEGSGGGSDGAGSGGGNDSIRKRGRKALKGVREKKRRSKAPRKTAGSKRTQAPGSESAARKPSKKTKLSRGSESSDGGSSSEDDAAYLAKEAERGAATHQNKQVQQKKQIFKSKETITDSDEEEAPLSGEPPPPPPPHPPVAGVALPINLFFFFFLFFPSLMF